MSKDPSVGFSTSTVVHAVAVVSSFIQHPVCVTEYPAGVPAIPPSKHIANGISPNVKSAIVTGLAAQSTPAPAQSPEGASSFPFNSPFKPVPVVIVKTGSILYLPGTVTLTSKIAPYLSKSTPPSCTETISKSAPTPVPPVNVKGPSTNSLPFKIRE